MALDPGQLGWVGTRNFHDSHPAVPLNTVALIHWPLPFTSYDDDDDDDDNWISVAPYGRNFRGTDPLHHPASIPGLACSSKFS